MRGVERDVRGVERKKPHGTNPDNRTCSGPAVGRRWRMRGGATFRGNTPSRFDFAGHTPRTRLCDVNGRREFKRPESAAFHESVTLGVTCERDRGGSRGSRKVSAARFARRPRGNSVDKILISHGVRRSPNACRMPRAAVRLNRVGKYAPTALFAINQASQTRLSRRTCKRYASPPAPQTFNLSLTR